MDYENHNVQYVFNQAAMAFFVISGYPAYTFEGGRMVEDNSEKAKTLQAQAQSGYDLLKSAAKRIKENKRVPQAWVRGIEDALPLAIAARDLRMSSSEWVDQLERAVRFLKIYSPEKQAAIVA
jgi:hypothetical protein